jgi:hypothetical protein
LLSLHLHLAQGHPKESPNRSHVNNPHNRWSINFCQITLCSSPFHFTKWLGPLVVQVLAICQALRNWIFPSEMESHDSFKIWVNVCAYFTPLSILYMYGHADQVVWNVTR